MSAHTGRRLQAKELDTCSYMVDYKQAVTEQETCLHVYVVLGHTESGEEAPFKQAGIESVVSNPNHMLKNISRVSQQAVQPSCA